MDNMELTVEATTVDDLKAKIAEIREEFGDEVYINAKLVSSQREKSFELVNDGLCKILNQFNKKFGG